jgi:hypothetical protein
MSDDGRRERAAPAADDARRAELRADGERLEAEGFSVIAIESRRGSFSPLRSLRDFFQALKIVRAERADIMHCIALRPVVIGGLAAKLAGTGALVAAPTGLGHLIN